MSDDFNKNLVKAVTEEKVGKVYDDLAHPTVNTTGQIIVRFFCKLYGFL